MILCGDGHGLSPFSAERPTGTFKPLLPVANRPMILYTLDWAKKANFSNVTIAVPATFKSEMELCLDNELKSFEGLNIHVHGYTTKYSAEIIAGLVSSSTITSDFAVLPCDLFTDVEPFTLVTNHRNRHRPNALISAIYYTNTVETIDKKALVPDCVAHTPLRGKADGDDTLLLDCITRAQVKAKKSLNVHNAMLLKHPNTVVSINLLSSAIYLCSRRLMELLQTTKTDSESAVVETATTTSPLYQGKQWQEFVRDIARRSWKHRQPLDPVVIDAITEPKSTLIRCNNLSAYLEANRLIMRQKARNSGRQENKAISADSAVGKDTIIGDKSTIKRTVVGNNCVIGPKCRLTGCIVLDNAVIDGDVHLENCIVGKAAIIRTKCRLTSCQVEGAYEVRASTQAKNEVLQSLSLDGELTEGETLSEDEEQESSGEEDGESDASDGSSHYSMSEGEDLSDNDGLFER